MARRARRSSSAPRSPSGQAFGVGVSLLALGIGLFIASWLLGRSSSPLLKVVAGQIDGPAPLLLVCGLVLAAAGHALRSRASKPASEPTWFPADSTDFVRSAVASELPPPPEHRGRRAPARQWGPQVFEDIEWHRFETLCARLFAQAGFEAKTRSHGADGGVDIWLHARHADGPAAVVQCKHWLGKPVGVKEVREFLGAMASQRLPRGTYATTSTFTPEAARFAGDNGIELLDLDGLLALIAGRTPQQQAELLAHAYEGEYWRPTCASCGLKMVERSARRDASGFWGCAAYPRCRFTLPLRRA
jgi:restriction system protein